MNELLELLQGMLLISVAGGVVYKDIVHRRGMGSAALNRGRQAHHG